MRSAVCLVGLLWGYALGCLAAAADDRTPVLLVPRGDEEIKSAIYRPAAAEPRPPAEPIRLAGGPHLFLDDFLIAKQGGLTRRVNCLPRDPRIPNPVITGKEDGNFQPYVSVVRDEKTGKFRMWYVARTKNRDFGTSHIAHMVSDDGIDWQRPARVLEDPGPMGLVHTVLDEGPGFGEPAERFKIAWWTGEGLKLGTSADGLRFTRFQPAVVLRPNHDISSIFRDPLRGRYVATLSAYTTGPTWSGQRRVTLHTVSKDFRHWEKPWYVLTPDDRLDPGQTQFYAMHGYLARGPLLIGLVKVLHDDQRASGTPQGSFGVGHTALAWTRDGEHWVRDREPFFQPDPKAGAWDHAHAWMDYQVPVGDEVYVYYGGYRNGHKVNRFEERQIGLVRMKRDRYVSRDAGAEQGFLCTPPVTLAAGRLTVNAAVRGELRVGLLDADGKSIPGFTADDCRPIQGDSLAHAVAWKKSPSAAGDRTVQIEFRLRDASLYAFELAPSP